MTLAWADVSRKAQGGPLLIHRKPRANDLYKGSRAHIEETHRLYSDYIKIKHLRWEAENDPSTGKIVARRGADAADVSLDANPYPYDLEPGIFHYVLWSAEPLSPEAMNAAVEARLGQVSIAPQLIEYVAFVNAVEDQSIRDLWHAHVFLRMRPACTFLSTQTL